MDASAEIQGQAAAVERGSVKLAELVASLSLATDLGRGERWSTASGVIALRIADRIGVDESDRVATHYTAELIGSVLSDREAARS